MGVPEGSLRCSAAPVMAYCLGMWWAGQEAAVPALQLLASVSSQLTGDALAPADGNWAQSDMSEGPWAPEVVPGSGGLQWEWPWRDPRATDCWFP